MQIISEIGINHSGDLDLCKNLMCMAKKAGCDYVKFQKRSINVVYTTEELDKPRESPWGTTQREQKHGLEVITVLGLKCSIIHCSSPKGSSRCSRTPCMTRTSTFLVFHSL